MKKRIIIGSILFISSFILFSFYSNKNENSSIYKSNNNKIAYLEGDIIFQSSQSTQCKAVKLATHSEYSHVGMITYIDGKPFVLEAVEPVRTTELATWIAHGTGGHYTVMRLKDRNNEILDAEIKIAQQLAKKMIGTHYDIYFNWSDDELYCSELVWKIYKRGYGVELCSLRTMKEFDLSSPEVKTIMKQRYGNNPPLTELVVAPSDLSNSPLLFEVEKK
ncbi:YiiX family permuted papain-like enzyme [uncultured Cytophaga sp.]|uniref:YiiX family permuted papain-like enzyme n=1 Tax=uncultured Cytophaga sp. TaxID=160238 RepID=UPI00260A508A|nr:YiiX family permuted papain-like enzyme [uncultured Cytophaga sp.]